MNDQIASQMNAQITQIATNQAMMNAHLTAIAGYLHTIAKALSSQSPIPDPKPK